MLAQAHMGVQVTTEDLTLALQGFVPSGLLNVSLVRNTTLCFANVGGMEVVKKLLTEVLIWPTKVFTAILFYNNLFKHEF